MFGLFSENGPFSVSPQLTLLSRQYTWNDKYSLIYIDNPVGAGFSFTDSVSGFVTNEEQVGANLYSALSQFFLVFPEEAANDFYVTGESYGGKYVPACAWTIHQMNKNPQMNKINLKGISIGDGMMDPVTQIPGYGDLAYSLSLADENQRAVIQNYEKKIVAHINIGQFIPAFRLFDELMNGDFFPYPTYFTNITGTTNYFNFLTPDYPPNPYPQFLNLDTTRLAIHVGNVPYFDYNSTVEEHLIGDWMVSVKPYLVVLLDNYKALIYNGQNDIILSNSQAENFLQDLIWSGSVQFKKVPRVVWKLQKTDTDPAGYVRSVDRFRQVVVRDAGHLLPLDQPERAYDMITRFINDIPF